MLNAKKHSLGLPWPRLCTWTLDLRLRAQTEWRKSTSSPRLLPGAPQIPFLLGGEGLLMAVSWPSTRFVCEMFGNDLAPTPVREVWSLDRKHDQSDALFGKNPF